MALGTTAADLGVITLVTLVVFAARPLPPLLALQTGLTRLRRRDAPTAALDRTLALAAL